MLNTKNKYNIDNLIIGFLNMFLIIVIVIPIVILFIKAFYKDGILVGFDNFNKYISNPRTIKLLCNSIEISFEVAIFAVISTFLFAYGTVLTNLKFKNSFYYIGMLPLFAPSMTYGMAVTYLFGNNGMLNKLLDIHFEIYGKSGIFLGEIIYVFPVLFLMFVVSLRTIDNRFYDLSNTLGINTKNQFIYVTIARIKDTLISAFLVAFIMVFTDFGIPAVLAGNYNVIALDLYNKVLGQQNFNVGAVISIIMLIPCITMLFVNQLSKNRNVQFESKHGNICVNKNKKRDCIFLIYNSLVAIMILSILIIIIMMAFFENWPYDLHLTLKWFNYASVGISPLKVYINTVGVSFCSAFLGTIIVFFSAYFVERVKLNRLNEFILRISTSIPMAIPGMVIGISYILFFNSQNNIFNFIYGTFFIIILSNVVHFCSVPMETTREYMKKINLNYECLAESMGIPWFRLFVDVIVPVAMPILLEDFCYIFINSMVTISAVSFLYTSKTKLASIDMINRYNSGDIASCAAIAVMLIVTNISVKIIIDRAIGKYKHSKKS